jgi:hypothetical protein
MVDEEELHIPVDNTQVLLKWSALYYLYLEYKHYTESNYYIC